MRVLRIYTYIIPPHTNSNLNFTYHPNTLSPPLMSNILDKKLILVIGATGAQGIAVIDKLLEPAADGSPSPYAVRALTRDPTSRRAKLLAAKGVELAKGAPDRTHLSHLRD